ncbi:hypothetical protein E2C01_081665 [Portunus trituberculatus]|uniref:Uncharacterized protein n=1 Tax=Portunus trituberculatus TaxID=210409 RepID=A0A5B7J1R3_PORTR|nr:hypothetical protein [Portunus trituberculatus]
MESATAVPGPKGSHYSRKLGGLEPTKRNYETHPSLSELFFILLPRGPEADPRKEEANPCTTEKSAHC